MQKKSIKYIFVVGGVMSGVGKGIASSSIGKILQARGFEVTALKIDPYVNVDAGTMNPTEHGEVFVLDDGTECDQDMGNYERFLNRDLTGKNYMTTGSVYLSVIQKERNLEFGGKCVSVVPNIPLEIISRLKCAAEVAKADIVITEVGGTVGEYQNILFLEAIRMLKVHNPGDVLVVLVSFVPALGAGGNELKTKPTQYAARSLNSAGLQADIIIARAKMALDAKRKEKIAENCNISEKDVISAPDEKNIYEIPLNFEKDNLSTVILKKLNIKPRATDLKEWRKLIEKMENAKYTSQIAIVGKYFGSGDFFLTDSYISVLEAIKHAGAVVGVNPSVKWIDSEEFEKQPQKLKELSVYDGIIIPGGFGSRGIEGKISVIKYCRENKIPYFGLCYGMQLAVTEYARHMAGMKVANTTEINSKTPFPVVDIMPEQKKNLKDKNFGATMRLGAYPAVLKKGSVAFSAYGVSEISERHRHRYEVNPEFIGKLEEAGLVFSGTSPDGRLMEIAELPHSKHPFFLGTQFHPELKSRPLNPHPLFVAFMKACVGKK
ncbi:MAG: CTP synthetase, CTP synthase [Parcubacteria group bacterium GW2011_GWC1_35_8]|uniref:CTP synthase n=2 Tax=Candidatus Nomuraibacteriota TaxID=1752729 RepID=A0A1F6YWD2_9BACT|nr:MAG: CTP synthetase, CTP synthase [Parcubacteria group bacterium GW2011_GWC1_35_8]OGJ05154.1 MAG: CTP synthase [Candidatus Nomurabacteria bacterium RIFOXYA2_FULL_35_9]OGJ10645.1 MAG: CTP synthase [Candidatus Nomurabacteria bacterium RIFOXYC2_FULL_36_19]OGJ14685.1 MAG: CTP synthase [Candidatus Nomurabacteria bacterium RIFOXYD2_FULL_35_12]